MNSLCWLQTCMHPVYRCMRPLCFHWLSSVRCVGFESFIPRMLLALRIYAHSMILAFWEIWLVLVSQVIQHHYSLTCFSLLDWLKSGNFFYNKLALTRLGGRLRSPIKWHQWCRVITEKGMAIEKPCGGGCVSSVVSVELEKYIYINGTFYTFF